MDNSSLSSMGTEQLINMFNKDDQTQKTGQTSKTDTDSLHIPGSYQRLIDNISEIWDESQYENEFNVTSFIDSLKK